ncbi:hypothetical protein TRFO_32095 [Tritrichomonas foetus]|uniref:Uncharacterized protein n=1 Tax=Tritrichomonas foetus TaxID=1144522 RepID=A0A1J4JR31_9EUKA|nr:hypothetical protein TRFO_32095 [Tritrichomonas foetus]|eukprot:OHT01202.1 hypothetical protein TRFO_32095 [Tritrichomonas foetus]
MLLKNNFEQRISSLEQTGQPLSSSIHSSHTDLSKYALNQSLSDLAQDVSSLSQEMQFVKQNSYENDQLKKDLERLKDDRVNIVSAIEFQSSRIESSFEYITKLMKCFKHEIKALKQNSINTPPESDPILSSSQQHISNAPTLSYNSDEVIKLNEKILELEENVKMLKEKDRFINHDILNCIKHELKKHLYRIQVVTTNSTGLAKRMDEIEAQNDKLSNLLAPDQIDNILLRINELEQQYSKEANRVDVNEVLINSDKFNEFEQRLDKIQNDHFESDNNQNELAAKCEEFDSAIKALKSDLNNLIEDVKSEKLNDTENKQSLEEDQKDDGKISELSNSINQLRSEFEEYKQINDNYPEIMERGGIVLDEFYDKEDNEDHDYEQSDQCNENDKLEENQNVSNKNSENPNMRTSIIAKRTTFFKSLIRKETVLSKEMEQIKEQIQADNIMINELKQQQGELKQQLQEFQNQQQQERQQKLKPDEVHKQQNQKQQQQPEAPVKDNTIIISKMQKLLVRHQQKIDKLTEQLNQQAAEQNTLKDNEQKIQQQLQDIQEKKSESVVNIIDEQIKQNSFENHELIQSLQNKIAEILKAIEPIRKLTTDSSDIKKVIVKFNHRFMEIKDNNEKYDKLAEDFEFMKKAVDELQSSRLMRHSDVSQDFSKIESEINALIKRLDSQESDVHALNDDFHDLSQQQIANQRTLVKLNNQFTTIQKEGDKKLSMGGRLYDDEMQKELLNQLKKQFTEQLENVRSDVMSQLNDVVDQVSKQPKSQPGTSPMININVDDDIAPNDFASMKTTISALKKLVLKDHKAIESIKETLQAMDSAHKKKFTALSDDIVVVKESLAHIQDGDTLNGKITVEFEKLKTIVREQLDPRSGRFGIYGYALKEEVDNVSQLLSAQIDELRGDFLVYKEQHKTVMPPLKLSIPPNVESQTFEGIGSFKDLCALVMKNKIRVAELGRYYNKLDDDVDAFRHQFDIVKHEVKKLMRNQTGQSLLGSPSADEKRERPVPEFPLTPSSRSISSTTSATKRQTPKTDMKPSTHATLAHTATPQTVSTRRPKVSVNSPRITKK